MSDFGNRKLIGLWYLVRWKIFSEDYFLVCYEEVAHNWTLLFKNPQSVVTSICCCIKHFLNKMVHRYSRFFTHYSEYVRQFLNKCPEYLPRTNGFTKVDQSLSTSFRLSFDGQNRSLADSVDTTWVRLRGAPWGFLGLPVRLTWPHFWLFSWGPCQICNLCIMVSFLKIGTHQSWN